MLPEDSQIHWGNGMKYRKHTWDKTSYYSIHERVSDLNHMHEELFSADMLCLHQEVALKAHHLHKDMVKTALQKQSVSLISNLARCFHLFLFLAIDEIDPASIQP